MEPALLIENLSFRYRSRQELALKDIQLTVTRGEILLIAGASGCGKTTLARCINGLIPRSYKGELSGRIQICGIDIAAMPLAKISQMVGTVLQDPERQILGSRVISEVAFGLENLGLPREEILAAAHQALEHLGISELRDRETFNLSGGEKQKVALAGVLAMKPDLLLLDEPLASLDPASAQETLEIVRRLADEGMTVLMVEHRVEDVLKISPDRVLYLQGGEIRYLGRLEGLYHSINYREVKLPAPMIAQLAKQEEKSQVFVPRLPSAENPDKTSLVSFREVCFFYDEDKPVLKGVNLDIRRGDIIAVLGANGAGKTTLVKHAIGLLKPKSGQVLVNGRDTHLQSVAQIAQVLGYVFQSPSHMLFAPTVEEELAFGPRNLGHPEQQIRKEVTEAIQIVHLSGMEKNPPLALSFGQQKRVSIAAVLAMRSRILVMDEPTAGQDYQNYMSFMYSILQLQGFEAVIFITHDVDLAVIFANRALLMDQGRIVIDDTPAEVLKDFDRLRACRVIPTSLLELNLQHYSRTRRLMSAEALAHVL